MPLFSVFLLLSPLLLLSRSLASLRLFAAGKPNEQDTRRKDEPREDTPESILEDYRDGGRGCCCCGGTSCVECPTRCSRLARPCAKWLFLFLIGWITRLRSAACGIGPSCLHVYVSRCDCAPLVSLPPPWPMALLLCTAARQQRVSPSASRESPHPLFPPLNTYALLTAAGRTHRTSQGPRQRGERQTKTHTQTHTHTLTRPLPVAA